jgi:hypothetical protein
VLQKMVAGTVYINIILNANYNNVFTSASRIIVTHPRTFFVFSLQDRGKSSTKIA